SAKRPHTRSRRHRYTATTTASSTTQLGSAARRCRAERAAAVGWPIRPRCNHTPTHRATKHGNLFASSNAPSAGRTSVGGKERTRPQLRTVLDKPSASAGAPDRHLPPQGSGTGPSDDRVVGELPAAPARVALDDAPDRRAHGLRDAGLERRGGRLRDR